MFGIHKKKPDRPSATVQNSFCFEFFSLYFVCCFALLSVMRFRPVYALVTGDIYNEQHEIQFCFWAHPKVCICLHHVSCVKTRNSCTVFFFDISFSYRKSPNFYTKKNSFFMNCLHPLHSSKSWIRFSFCIHFVFAVRSSSLHRLFLFIVCMPFVHLKSVFNVHYPTLWFHGISGPCSNARFCSAK